MRAETAIRTAAAAVPTSVGDALEVIVEVERRHERIRDTAEATVGYASDPDRLLDRLGTDDRLAGMFLDVLEAAGRTHLDAKRRLLAGVVARAAA